MSSQPGLASLPSPPQPARPVISHFLTISFIGTVFANLVLIGFLIFRLTGYEDSRKRAAEAAQELSKTRDQLGTIQQDLRTLEERKIALAPLVDDWQKRVQEKAAAEAALISFQERERQNIDDINQSSNRLQQLNSDLASFVDQKASTAGEIQRLLSERDLLTRTNIELRAILAQALDAERRRSEAQAVTESASSALKQAEAEIQANRSSVEKSQKQIDDLRQSREKLTTEIASLQQQAETIKEYLASNQKTAAEVGSRQAAVQKANEELAKIREKRAAIEGLSTEAEDRFQRVTADLTNLVARTEVARKDMAEVEAKRANVRTDSQTVEQDLAAMRKTMTEYQSTRDNLTVETSRLEAQVQRLKTDRDALQKEIGQLTAQRPNPAPTEK